MRDIQSLLLSSELSDLTGDIRDLFDDLDQHLRTRRPAPTGTCSPQVDLLETDAAYEVVIDLPGVVASDLRAMVKDQAVLVVGEKAPPDLPLRAEATFHLVERSFGRFARAVHLPGAVDARHASATVQGGELRVIVPKIADRRGRVIRIPVHDA